MVSNGWYERRPDATRNRWTHYGLVALIVAVVVTGVLAAFTTFGLVGLALVVWSLGLMFVGQEMPARTAKGAALLGGPGALRSDLMSHPTDQMPPGRELQEISRGAAVHDRARRRPTAGSTPWSTPTPTRRPTPPTCPGTTVRATGTCATCPDSLQQLRHHRLGEPVLPLRRRR